MRVCVSALLLLPWCNKAWETTRPWGDKPEPDVRLAAHFNSELGLQWVQPEQKRFLLFSVRRRKQSFFPRASAA